MVGLQVDDDDRDFRRSKRHDSEYGGEQPRRPTAPITVGRGDSNFAGKKRRNEDGGPRYTSQHACQLWQFTECICKGLKLGRRDIVLLMSIASDTFPYAL